MAAPLVEAAPAAESVGASRNAPRQPMGPLRRGIREVGLALITLGVIVLLFVAYQLWGTGIAERHSQAALKRGFNAAVVAHQAGDNPTVEGAGGSAGSGTSAQSGVGAASTTASPAPAPGGALDHLVIPKIGLNAYVVEGVSESDLRRGPGHYPQTVLPGQNGNAGIAGHRTTYGAPFYSINELKIGDPISLTDTAGRTFVYKVSQAPLVVSPSDVSVLANTPYPQLTLTTCNPRFSATSRMVVVARLAGQPPLPVAHAPTVKAPVAAAAVDNLGRGDGGAWPAALLYGGLVVLLWAGVRLLINRTRRWTRLGVYVLGIGVCLIPLWFCFENVVRLLPQNI
jgi:sortase A